MSHRQNWLENFETKNKSLLVLNSEFMRRSKVVETWKVFTEFVNSICGEYQDQTVEMLTRNYSESLEFTTERTK